MKSQQRVVCLFACVFVVVFPALFACLLTAETTDPSLIYNLPVAATLRSQTNSACFLFFWLARSLPFVFACSLLAEMPELQTSSASSSSPPPPFILLCPFLYSFLYEHVGFLLTCFTFACLLPAEMPEKQSSPPPPFASFLLSFFLFLST